MKTATIDNLISWRPCPGYPDDRVRALAGGVTEFTALDVLRRDDIPARDRLWVVVREELIDARALRIFACDCADRALSRVENPDARSVDAVRVSRLYANGDATTEQLAAARDAAWVAAWAAARAAELEWQIAHLIEMLEATR